MPDPARDREGVDHWAYRLSDLPSGHTPYWARETVANHAHPEYWAMLWGWSGEAVARAKAHHDAVRVLRPEPEGVR